VDETPSVAPVEQRIAGDLARHGMLVAPRGVLAGGLYAGFGGAASVAVGFALVVLNFLVTARILAWATRRSPTALAVTALSGFFLRMAALLIAMLVADALFGWIDVVVLAVTVFAAHLALLFWELRSVSLSFAAPGLRRDRPTALARERRSSP
jgi:hypothetical protein